jgi:hypothetical protein
LPVYVKGLAEVNYLLSKADKETRLGLRKEEREVAKPISSDAERLTVQNIPRTTLGKVRWWEMRIGVTQTLIYVAPKQKGVRGKGPKRRKKFAPLMMERAMEPALKRHESEVEQRFEHVLDYVAGRFNAAGKVVP